MVLITTVCEILELIAYAKSHPLNIYTQLSVEGFMFAKTFIRLKVYLTCSNRVSSFWAFAPRMCDFVKKSSDCKTGETTFVEAMGATCIRYKHSLAV